MSQKRFVWPLLIFWRRIIVAKPIESKGYPFPRSDSHYILREFYPTFVKAIQNLMRHTGTAQAIKPTACAAVRSVRPLLRVAVSLLE